MNSTNSKLWRHNHILNSRTTTRACNAFPGRAWRRVSVSVFLPPSLYPLRATLITFNVVDFHELRRREEGNMLETTWVWVTVFVFFSYLVSPFPNSLLCSPCVVVTSLGTLSLSPSPPHTLTLVRYCFLSASAAKGPATPTRAHCKDSRTLWMFWVSVFSLLAVFSSLFFKWNVYAVIVKCFIVVAGV